MMLSLWTLNNPIVTPIMALVAAFLIGAVIGAVAILLATQSRIVAKADIYAKAERRRLHARHAGDLRHIATLEDRIVTLKAKIGVMALYMGKAVTEARIDE